MNQLLTTLGEEAKELQDESVESQFRRQVLSWKEDAGDTNPDKSSEKRAAIQRTQKEIEETSGEVRKAEEQIAKSYQHLQQLDPPTSERRDAVLKLQREVQDEVGVLREPLPILPGELPKRKPPTAALPEPKRQHQRKPERKAAKAIGKCFEPR